jgi:hypothetical protein
MSSPGYWAFMALIWILMSIAAAVLYIGDQTTMHLMEFAFLSLQALAAWGAMKKALEDLGLEDEGVQEEGSDD